MDDILKRQAVRPKKPRKKCSGCGTLEGDEQFLKCPKCDELKLIPSVFCSQSCFAASWKEHKDFHDYVHKNVLITEEFHKIEEHYGSDVPSAYETLVDEALNKYNQNYFNEAKKVLQRAIKTDPRRSNAYRFLGQVYCLSTMLEDGCYWYEHGIERAAFVALTGICGNEKVCFLKARTAWAEIVGLTISAYAGIDREKKSWFRQNELLLNVTKSVLEIHKAVTNLLTDIDGEAEETLNDMYDKIDDSLSDLIGRIASIRAYLLIGMFSGGEKLSYFDPISPPALHNISPKDLVEAANCFEILARNDASKYDDDRSEMMFYSAECLGNKADYNGILEKSGARSYIDRSVPGDFSVGSWVTVKGLQSETGRALNGKLGYILSGPSKERYAVEFDGTEGKKIKGCNLDPVPIDVVNRGLLACLKKEDQWNFMSDVVIKKRIALQVECGGDCCSYKKDERELEDYSYY